MKYVATTLVTILLTILLVFVLFVTFTPGGRAMINGYNNTMQKVDDRTLYETRKKVEDEARAMVASYNTDKLRYEQYKASDNEDHKSWGEQAKMRANQTATIYNEFLLKNSYVFDGNIPADINFQLQIIP